MLYLRLATRTQKSKSTRKLECMKYDKQSNEWKKFKAIERDVIALTNGVEVKITKGLDSVLMLNLIQALTAEKKSYIPKKRFQKLAKSKICFFDRKTGKMNVAFIPELMTVCEQLNRSLMIFSTAPVIHRRSKIITRFNGNNSNLPMSTKISQSLAPEISDENFSFILRDYQKEAVSRTLSNKRGLLDLATNAGKTLIAFFSMLNEIRDDKTARAIYCSDSREILTQTIKLAKEFFPEYTVGIWAGEEKTDGRFIIATVQSLKRLTKPLEKVKIIMVDEVHKFNNETGKWLTNTYKDSKIFGMSGSAFTGDTYNVMKMRSLFGNSLANVSTIDLKKMGVSAEGSVFMIPIPGDKEVLMELKRLRETGMDEYTTIETAGIVQNPLRNEILTKIAINQFNQGRYIVMLVKRIEHGEVLRAMLEQRLNSNSIQFLKGESNKKERERAIEAFKSGHSRIMIATTILDTGVSINEIDTMINCCGGASDVKTIQRFGRILRQKSVHFRFFDTIDSYYPIFRRHSTDRSTQYRRIGAYKIHYVPIDKILAMK